MAHNFIILYTSREGSSAIVQQLSLQSSISVPLMEELDRYWIERHYPGASLAEEIDKAFSTGSLDWEHDYARRNFVASQRDTTGTESIGFKWRCHGRFKDVLRVLRDHDVMVFVLLRRDLVDLTSSLYFTKTLKSQRKNRNYDHTQFYFSKADVAGSEAFRRELDSTVLPMRPLYYFSLMGWRIWRAFQNKVFAWRAARGGLKTATIFYEDFNEDPQRFVSDFMRKLGLEYDPNTRGELRHTLQKPSHKPPREKIRNMWIVDYNPLTYVLKATYSAICRWTF